MELNSEKEAKHQSNFKQTMISRGNVWGEYASELFEKKKHLHAEA